MLNLVTEVSVELWRGKTTVVIPKLLIKRDTNVTKGRIFKLDLEMIIQGVDLMLMKDRADLSMISCSILGENTFNLFKTELNRVIVIVFVLGM